MMVHSALQSWVVGSDPLNTVLPLALAAFATAVVFSVHRLVGLFSDRDQSSQHDQSISKGANQ